MGNEEIDEFNKRLMEKEEECREKSQSFKNGKYLFFTLFVKIVCCRDLQKKVDGKHLEDRLEELEPLEQSTKYMENILKGNFVFK